MYISIYIPIPTYTPIYTHTPTYTTHIPIDESWMLLNYAALTKANSNTNTNTNNNSNTNTADGYRGRDRDSRRERGSVHTSTTTTASKQPHSHSISDSYTRSDLCEIEPSMVSCILRILVNYVKNIEKVDVKALTKAQKDCYVVTLEVCVYVCIYIYI